MFTPSPPPPPVRGGNRALRLVYIGIHQNHDFFGFSLVFICYFGYFGYFCFLGYFFVFVFFCFF